MNTQELITREKIDQRATIIGEERDEQIADQSTDDG